MEKGMIEYAEYPLDILGVVLAWVLLIGVIGGLVMAFVAIGLQFKDFMYSCKTARKWRYVTSARVYFSQSWEILEIELSSGSRDIKLVPTSQNLRTNKLHGHGSDRRYQWADMAVKQRPATGSYFERDLEIR